MLYKKFLVLGPPVYVTALEYCECPALATANGYRTTSTTSPDSHKKFESCPVKQQ